MSAQPSGRLFVVGGQLLCPASETDGPFTLVLEDGRVVDRLAATEPVPEGAPRLDATGCVVAPGFVDLHAHLGEPGEEHKEDLESGGRAALRGGFTTVVVGSDTRPVNDQRAVTDWIARRAAALPGPRILPIGALTLRHEGRRLTEMFDLRAGGAVALGDGDRCVADAGLLRRAMEYARAVGLPVFESPEDASLAGHGVMHEGETSTRLGLAGIPACAEEVVVRRDLVLAELAGIHLHLGPISTAGAVDAIREAKRRGQAVSCAVTAAHLVLTDEAVAQAYSTHLRVRPPFRSQAHVDALLEGVADGTIDAIASGHRPQSPVEKDVEFDLAEPGITALETTLGVCLRLVESGRLTLSTVLARLGTGPASVLHLSAGRLAVGDPADLVVFAPRARVRVEPARFASRSRNTPFAGQALPGRVRATVVGGEVRWTEASGGE
jgi:dihydroorotase